MIELRSRVDHLADREAWAAHGASFVAKAKATKAIWFPPAAVKDGTKAATTATRATKKATGKTAKKATGSAKKATSKTRGTAKKATGKVTRKTTGKKSA